MKYKILVNDTQIDESAESDSAIKKFEGQIRKHMKDFGTIIKLVDTEFVSTVKCEITEEKFIVTFEWQ